MEVRILGPVEVQQGGDRTEITGERERALLAALALRPGEACSVASLVDHLWDESTLPANPANALQVRVSRLRKVLGPDVLVSRPGGYALELAPEAVDAVRFERLVAAARQRDDPEERVRMLEQALVLWRGRDEPAPPWFDTAAAVRLQELRTDARHLRARALVDGGRAAEAIGELQSLAAAHPLNEGVRATLMLALYHAGRQAEALAVFRDASRVLGEELGIEPGPELRRIEEQILLHDHSITPVGNTPSLPVPAFTGGSVPRRLTSFVGRTDELDELNAVLSEVALVTLVGPGGTGKTRLALELADGLDVPVFFIDLARVAPGSPVEEAVAEGLGGAGAPGVVPRPATPAAMIKDRLGGRAAILILDNCEHVIESAARLAEAVATELEGVRVVATSRQRLGVPGEQVWRTPSLMVGRDDPGPAELLFADRAAAIDPAFTLDTATTPVVREICRRLDGLPLAIELAAALVPTLTVEQILERLDRRFDLLTQGARTALPRQQTLEAALEWSYSLLEPAEARLLRMLGITRGSWGLDLAESMVGDAAEGFGVLSGLVDRSLVERVDRDSGRFRLLETVRVYARAQLEKGGERATAARNYVDHYAALAAAAEPHLRSGDQLPWLDRLRGDRDNLRHAVEVALDEGWVDDALMLAGSLGFFWFTEALIDEEQAVVMRALAAGGSPAARARGIQDVDVVIPGDRVSVRGGAGIGGRVARHGAGSRRP